jgi:hypothetical protein
MRFASRLVLACALAVSTSGCALLQVFDVFNQDLALQEAHQKYTQAMRWARFSQAAKFVAPEGRADFLAGIKAFDNFRFTDYELDEFELEGERKEAILHVTYRGYDGASLVEESLEEVQQWTRDDYSRTWHVKSSFITVSSPGHAAR